MSAVVNPPIIQWKWIGAAGVGNHRVPPSPWVAPELLDAPELEAPLPLEPAPDPPDPTAPSGPASSPVPSESEEALLPLEHPSGAARLARKRPRMRASTEVIAGLLSKRRTALTP